MAFENILEADEALAIEEADAWFEYLEAIRSHSANERYDEVEPWAWARLSQRLGIVEVERGRLRPAAAWEPLLPCEKNVKGSTEPGSGERESRRSFVYR